jgi:hypothetical protein
MTFADRIEINPKVMMGKPVIQGTRIQVELILRKLSEGERQLLEVDWGQVYFISILFSPQEKSFGEDLRGRLKNWDSVVIYKKIGPALKHIVKDVERSEQIKARSKLLGH